MVPPKFWNSISHFSFLRANNPQTPNVPPCRRPLVAVENEISIHNLQQHGLYRTEDMEVETNDSELKSSMEVGVISEGESDMDSSIAYATTEDEENDLYYNYESDAKTCVKSKYYFRPRRELKLTDCVVNYNLSMKGNYIDHFGTSLPRGKHGEMNSDLDKYVKKHTSHRPSINRKKDKSGELPDVKIVNDAIYDEEMRQPGNKFLYKESTDLIPLKGELPPYKFISDDECSKILKSYSLINGGTAIEPFIHSEITNYKYDVTEYYLVYGAVPREYIHVAQSLAKSFAEMAAKGRRHELRTGEIETCTFRYWQLCTTDLVDFELKREEKKYVKFCITYACVLTMKNCKKENNGKLEKLNKIMDLIMSWGDFGDDDSVSVELMQVIRLHLVDIFDCVSHLQTRRLWFYILYKCKIHHYMAPHTLEYLDSKKNDVMYLLKMRLSEYRASTTRFNSASYLATTKDLEFEKNHANKCIFEKTFVYQLFQPYVPLNADLMELRIMIDNLFFMIFRNFGNWVVQFSLENIKLESKTADAYVKTQGTYRNFNYEIPPINLSKKIAERASKILQMAIISRMYAVGRQPKRYSPNTTLRAIQSLFQLLRYHLITAIQPVLMNYTYHDNSVIRLQCSKKKMYELLVDSIKRHTRQIYGSLDDYEVADSDDLDVVPRSELASYSTSSMTELVILDDSSDSDDSDIESVYDTDLEDDNQHYFVEPRPQQQPMAEPTLTSQPSLSEINQNGNNLEKNDGDDDVVFIGTIEAKDVAELPSQTKFSKTHKKPSRRMCPLCNLKTTTGNAVEFIKIPIHTCGKCLIQLNTHPKLNAFTNRQIGMVVQERVIKHYPPPLLFKYRDSRDELPEVREHIELPKRSELSRRIYHAFQNRTTTSPLTFAHITEDELAEFKLINNLLPRDVNAVANQQ